MIDKVSLVIGIMSLVALVIFLAIFIPITVVNQKYTSFVIQHSVALKTLLGINKKYKFKNLHNEEMSHDYDNENFYNDISCQDYLTYQLVYEKKKIQSLVDDALFNKQLFEEYIHEIKNTCFMNRFDADIPFKNLKKLNSIEEKVFLKNQFSPTISFCVNVHLTRVNINGDYITSKSQSFYSNKIREIIYKLNKKNGNYYANSDIWEAICRVERGKVTNRMRFAIYNRDHNRCRKCGSTRNLEIDHIIPISKGGKSTMDNLQTLCHRCNVEKGNRTE